MTADLAALARRYRASLERSGEARSALYAAIRAERERGASWGDLARRTGLSRERVRQIADA